MRDNESDGAGGWWQSPEQDAGTRRPGPGATPPSDSDYPDTIAFGTPPGSPGAGNQVGYGNQAGYGQGYYGNQDGYPGGYGDQGGGAGPGWPMPDPPPGRRSPRGGRVLVYVAVAALAAGVGAGATVAFGGHSTPPAAGVSSGDVPGPHDNASGSGAEEGGSGTGRHHVEPQVQQRDGRRHRDDHFCLGPRADQ